MDDFLEKGGLIRIFKLVCNTCGNEVNLIKPKDKEERSYNESEGWYVTEDELGSFDIIGEYDQIWITCNGCDAKVWMFT